MTNSDKLLERIVKRVNQSGDSLDITITVGGTLITGRLTSRAAWLRSSIEALNQVDAMKGFADEFATEGGSLDTEDALHLAEGRVVFGAEPLVFAGTGFLRVPLAKVDSWAIGRVDIRRD
jgi:hypothetical protein